jgi:TusA-related sulfurtransferase
MRQSAVPKVGGEPEFAKKYYFKGGEPTKELTCMREAIKPLRRLYGHSEAREFGPKSLKAVRQHMIGAGLSRGVINRRVGRIKRVFKWAVAEEIVPPSVYHGLLAITGLQYGRTEARETEPVKPVRREYVDAVLPYVSPPVVALIELQWLTGMRPCEVVVTEASRAQASSSFNTATEEVARFVEAIANLYATMDASLRFKPARSETPSPVAEPAKPKPTATREADFRGVVCPLNYVKTKMLLDGMARGSILSVLLDEAGARNVPASVEKDGHEVLSVQQEAERWRVLIRKD